MSEKARKLLLVGLENLIMFIRFQIYPCFSTHIHPISCLHISHSLTGPISLSSVLLHVPAVVSHLEGQDRSFVKCTHSRADVRDWGVGEHFSAREGSPSGLSSPNGFK